MGEFHRLLKAAQAAVAGQNPEAARAALREAALHARTWTHGFQLATQWNKLREDDEVHNALRLALRNWDVVDQWRLRMTVMEKWLGDRTERYLAEILAEAAARKSMEPLHAVVLDSLGQRYVIESKAWNDVLVEYTRQCQGKARTHDEYHAVLLQWLYLQRDDEESHAAHVWCTERMEAVAKGRYEWSCCAEAWDMLPRYHPDRMEQCLKQLKRQCRTWEDWLHTTRLLAGMARLDAGTKWQAVKELESLAGTAEQWNSCAMIWRRQLGSEENADRCRRWAARMKG